MSTFNKIFQEEISRLARKEFRKQIETYTAALGKQRKEISDLRKRISQLESGPKRTKKATNVVVSNRSRISPRGIKAIRSKFSISQTELGQLVDVTQITVHNWEAGKSKPRQAQLIKLKEVQALGKKEVKQKLSSPSA